LLEIYAPLTTPPLRPIKIWTTACLPYETVPLLQRDHGPLFLPPLRMSRQIWKVKIRFRLLEPRFSSKPFMSPSHSHFSTTVGFPTFPVLKFYGMESREFQVSGLPLFPSTTLDLHLFPRRTYPLARTVLVFFHREFSPPGSSFLRGSSGVTPPTRRLCQNRYLMMVLK